DGDRHLIRREAVVLVGRVSDYAVVENLAFRDLLVDVLELPLGAETLAIADLHVADLCGFLAWNSAKHQEAAEIIHALAVQVVRRPWPDEVDAVASELSGEVRDRLRSDLIGAARVGLQTTRGDADRSKQGEYRRS